MDTYLAMQQESARLREKNQHLEKENSALESEKKALKGQMKLQEPLVQTGALVRRRFLDQEKERCDYGHTVDSIIETGNRAAHEGDLKADIALFRLGFLKAPPGWLTKDEGPSWFQRAFTRTFHDIYGFEPLLNVSLSSKETEIINMVATMACCLSDDERKVVEKVTWKADWKRIKILFNEGCSIFSQIEGQLLEVVQLAFDSHPQVDEICKEMRDIVDRTVRWNMNRKRGLRSARQRI